MLSHESKIIIDYLNIHKQPSEPRQGEQKVLTRFVNEVDQYLRLKRGKNEVKIDFYLTQDDRPFIHCEPVIHIQK